MFDIQMNSVRQLVCEIFCTHVMRKCNECIASLPVHRVGIDPMEHALNYRFNSGNSNDNSKKKIDTIEIVHRIYDCMPVAVIIFN